MTTSMRYRASAVAGLALIVLAACGGQGADPATGATPAAEFRLETGPELVQNGDFAAGLTGWNTWLMNGGAATYAVKGGRAVVTIHASATDYSGIQLSTGVPFALEQGKTYRLSFRARADYPTTLRTSVWENGTDLDGDGFAWSTHRFDTFAITDTMTRYTAEFTMTSSDPAAGLCFFLGDQSGRVFLDDVSVVEVLVPPLGTELVKNGGFSGGLNHWSLYLMNGGQATFGVERKQAVVDVTARASDYSGVQLQYVGGLPLVAGRTYQLRFKARADAPVTVMSSVWENGHDLDQDGFAWSTYKFSTHAVGTQQTEYTAVFQMPRTNLDAGIAFFLGEASGKVYFDDVSLVEIEPPAPQDLIHNGRFDAGLTGWTTYFTNGGSATYAVEDGRAVVTVLSPASDYSGIQLSNNGLPLEAGKAYRLTFRAGTDGATGALGTSLWENGHDTNGDGFSWSTYRFDWHTIGPAMQTYTVEFAVSATNPDAGLCFFLGSLSGRVFIDDVSLVEIDGLPPPPPPPPAGTELVVNGTFDAGLEGWNPFVLDGATGSVTVEGGEAVLTTTAAGPGLGYVQIDSVGALPLQAGRTYRLSLRARGDVDQQLLVLLWDVANSAILSEQWLTVGPDMTTSTFDVVAGTSTTTGSIGILSGQQVGQVFVDDVSLVELP